MVATFQQVYGIQRNCPTCFVIVHMIATDLERSNEALRGAVVSEEWDDAAGDSVNAAKFKAIVMSEANGRGGAAATQDFWDSLAIVIELLQPARDAIHRLEADRPALSQVLPSGVCSKIASSCSCRSTLKTSVMASLISSAIAWLSTAMSQCLQQHMCSTQSILSSQGGAGTRH
eukprot:363789-Chlamydomonas_euryale.AAC.12